ncbi:O-phosphoseryl-tRNA(Sec) selenium transferase, SepSecS [Popillia japonica]|uniref:O-phosphoseryl-tRNA(Sec) selenium transferase, SepSecS n=1 Tax=Popillia japonica TaxID=7064 RepID=A0AAW1KLF7_POPJA
MANQDKIIQLFEQKIPHLGWDMRTIDYLLSYMSSMDCNNFINKANVGEREGRCISGDFNFKLQWIVITLLIKPMLEKEKDDVFQIWWQREICILHMV